jgi:hypothetical protein
MSVYRFKINNNIPISTSGVTVNNIDPMLNTGTTGNQKFNSYLTIYGIKPGQILNNRYGDLVSRFEVKNSEQSSGGNLQAGFGQFKNFVKEDLFALGFENRKSLATIISSGNTINNGFIRNISIPIETKSTVVDYSDDIDAYVKKETKKRINSIINYERVKYNSKPYLGINIKFRFYNKNTNQYDDNTLSGGYSLAGFTNDEINKKNNFKKSFFRLYFFDTNDTKNQNLLFTEEIDVFNSQKPEFIFNRIFWLQEDEFFMTNNNRVIYMEARFFNAKTGRVHRFINLPISVSNPISINSLKVNQEWKTSKLKIISPNSNNGKYEFETISGVGANTQNAITMTEYILDT